MDDYPAADPIPDLGDMDDVGIRSYHNDLVEFLTNSKEMRETARSSVKQAAFAGGGALAGGFLLGPVGGLVGGICGSVLGFLQSDDYDGVLMTVSKLDEDQKKTLMTRVGQVLVGAGATAQQLIAQGAFQDTLLSFSTQPKVREELWRTIHSLQS